MILTFTLHGEPIAKARPRMTRGGRAYTPARTLDHEARLADACLKALADGWEKGADYKLVVSFHLPTKRAVDLDNLVKAVDGLNGVAFYDDSQIVHIDARKSYDKENPRTEVTLVPETLDPKTADKRRLAFEAKMAKRAARKARPRKSPTGRTKRLPRAPRRK